MSEQVPERAQGRSNFIQFAATPILLREVKGHDAMNKSLCEIIMALREKMAPELRTNVGGWQSPAAYNFVETLPAELKGEFMGIVWQAVVDLVTPLKVRVEGYKPRTQSWANVSMKGAYNLPHIHPNGVWSMVYYLAGDQGAGGELHLADPRPQSGMFQSMLSQGPSEMVYRPENSSLIVFPSWVMHYVEPYKGETPRINVAMNFL